MRRVRKTRKARHRTVLVRPAREWMIGLLFAGLLFLGCSVFAGMLFYNSLRNLENGPQTQTEVAEIYARDAVEKALLMYREKQRAFEALREIKVSIPGEGTASSSPALTNVEEGGSAEDVPAGPPVAQ